MMTMTMTLTMMTMMMTMMMMMMMMMMTVQGVVTVGVQLNLDYPICQLQLFLGLEKKFAGVSHSN